MSEKTSMDGKARVSEVLVGLFLNSKLSRDEFIRQSGVPRSTFFKVLKVHRDGLNEPGYHLDTIQRWIETSAQPHVNLKEEWLDEVLKLSLSQNLINRICSEQHSTSTSGKDSVWKKFFKAAIPDSFGLLFSKTEKE
jgi:hypothetical protein